jgi:hypothetical protein
MMLKDDRELKKLLKDIKKFMEMLAMRIKAA